MSDLILQDSFLLWCQPNRSDIEVLKLTEVKSDIEDKVILAPFLGESRNYGFSAIQTIQPDKLNSHVKPRLNQLENRNNSTHNDHLKQVKQAVDALKQTTLQKVVLARIKVIETAPNPIDLFLQLNKAYPQACVFLFNTPETGCWMGATPETLLHVEENKVFANSLAGTRPVGSAGDWGEKEQEEQQLVTDEIVANFENLGITNIQLDGPVTKSAGPVEHLFTQVSGSKPDNISPEEIARQLHPTPAVGGLPRDKALQFIRENEQINRSYYSGYFGISTPKSSTFYVNLRCMELYANGLVLYAGGGITAASNPEAEWDETERKLQTLLRFI